MKLVKTAPCPKCSSTRTNAAIVTDKHLGDWVLNRGCVDCGYLWDKAK